MSRPGNSEGMSVADTACGRLVFRNEMVVVYEVRENPEADLESAFVVPVGNVENWHVFAGELGARRANAMFSRAWRASKDGDWPTTVAFHS